MTDKPSYVPLNIPGYLRLIRKILGKDTAAAVLAQAVEAEKRAEQLKPQH